MNWLVKTHSGLACCVVAAVLLAVLGNVFVYLGEWNGAMRQQIVPAGWEWVDRVVGYVCLGLFACMGTAAWLAYSSGQPTAARDSYIVVGLMLVCILYPFYTLGLQAVPGLIGNVVVVILTILAAIFVRRSSSVAVGLLAPVALWVSLATVYVARLIAANANHN